ncbi:flippase-like domain-containing protein [Phaeovibrio sulfidiphilus]|uniref:Flippase-like domain-containing protein n=1 Tax=Phaeovibrio sulfidiphilus TaxID=1220600 RepID=A0A8J6YMZ1_9PROT|nr:lysylphosphatidylglycerol synthase domain-containing protein [Phaeovibrio sulfidiphilus]MBE1237615.1 flippase-like domain-containing protein [Phaeovibrio sulfidiphilus]
MIRRAALLGLVGLAIFTGLFIWRDAGTILSVFLSSGFALLGMVLVHFASMLVNARAWQVLVVEGHRPNLLQFFWAVWLRESVNGLLPVARVGGEVVTAKLLNNYGMSMPAVVASLAADVTICIGTQFLFTFLGLGLFVLYYQNAGLMTGLAATGVAALVVAFAFYQVQKKGMFRLVRLVVDKMFGDRFRQWTDKADTFDDSIRSVYRHRRAIFACSFWQFLGWTFGAVEIGVALYFMGQHTLWADPVIVESIVQAASSSAFVVPGALGVQEASFVVVCGWLGIVAETALALALVRRARDVVLFVPVLIVWQAVLGHKLLSSDAG